MQALKLQEHRPLKPHIQEKLKTKAKIEKNKETVKPTVINDYLIKDYLDSYNKENKIFEENETKIWELTHLSLSYKSK